MLDEVLNALVVLLPGRVVLAVLAPAAAGVAAAYLLVLAYA